MDCGSYILNVLVAYYFVHGLFANGEKVEYKMSGLEKNCGTKEVLSTEEECKQASRELGLTYLRNEGINPGFPAGCFSILRQKRVWFNQIIDPSLIYTPSDITTGICKVANKEIIINGKRHIKGKFYKIIFKRDNCQPESTIDTEQECIWAAGEHGIRYKGIVPNGDEPLYQAGCFYDTNYPNARTIWFNPRVDHSKTNPFSGCHAVCRTQDFKNCENCAKMFPSKPAEPNKEATSERSKKIVSARTSLAAKTVVPYYDIGACILFVLVAR